jgi:competence protein ComEC
MPLLWLSTAFLFGILLGSITSLLKTVLLSVFILCVFLAILEKRFTPRLALLKEWGKVSPLPLAMLVAALALGAWRLPQAVGSWTSGDIAFYNDGGEITLSAVVESLPIQTDSSTSFTARSVAISTTTASESPLVGKIQVLASPLLKVGYGDQVKIIGNPQTPPEEETFSYRDYLARKDIHSLIRYPRMQVISSGHGNPVMAALYSLRLGGYEAIRSILPQPQAALLSGILLGLDQDLPDDLTSAFQETGTAHIIAISGFNIAIISAFFFWALRLIASRWKAAFFSILAVFLYALLVGAEPAVMRAAIMGGMAILGTQIGRRGAGLNTLVFTAAVMCFFDPYLLWDVSFQLSFAATLGLIVIGNPLLKWFTGWLEARFPAGRARSIADPVGEYLLLTLAAQIATLPLMAWHFHQVSLSAILANPLILPAQPLIMTLGAAAMLAGLIFPPLGQLLGWLVYPPLAYTIWMVETLARLNGSIKVGSSAAVWILLLLACVAVLVLIGRRFPGWLRPGFAFLIGLLAVVIIWKGVAATPDGRLHVTLLAQEGGHAVLIRSPQGQSILINGAPSGSTLLSTLEKRFSPLDRNLETLILIEAQSKPLQGLNSLAEQMDVGQVFWGTGVPKTSATRVLQDTLRSSGAASSLLEKGQVFQVEPGIELSVPSSSEKATALRLDLGNFTLLLPGGTPPDVLNSYIRSGEASVIILDANDLAAASANEWNRLNPLAVLWNETTLDAPDPSWISTRDRGQVEVVTDGTQWILQEVE